MAKKATTVRGVDVYKQENHQGRSAMGDSIYEAKVQARSAQYGKLEPRRKGEAKGMIEAATAKHRAGIQENMGCQLHPTAKLPGPQDAPHASETWSRTKLVPSATVRTEFEGNRKYGLMGY